MLLVCASCGHDTVVKTALINVNDNSIIEELGAETQCTECNAPCEAIAVTEYAQRCDGAGVDPCDVARDAEDDAGTERDYDDGSGSPWSER